MEENLPGKLAPLDPEQMFSDIGEDSDSDILNYEFGSSVQSFEARELGARTIDLNEKEVELGARVVDFEARTGELGAKTVWEGFVLKRGEHWKNWRQR